MNPLHGIVPPVAVPFVTARDRDDSVNRLAVAFPAWLIENQDADLLRKRNTASRLHLPVIPVFQTAGQEVGALWTEFAATFRPQPGR